LRVANEDLSPLPLPLSCKERGVFLPLPYEGRRLGG